MVEVSLYILHDVLVFLDKELNPLFIFELNFIKLLLKCFNLLVFLDTNLPECLVRHIFKFIFHNNRIMINNRLFFHITLLHLIRYTRMIDVWRCTIIYIVMWLVIGLYLVVHRCSILMCIVLLYYLCKVITRI